MSCWERYRQSWKNEMEANVWFCLVPVVKVNELIKLVPVLKNLF